jgi:hypothetical protein
VPIFTRVEEAAAMEEEESIGPSWSRPVTPVEAVHSGRRRRQQLIVALELGPFGISPVAD